MGRIKNTTNKVCKQRSKLMINSNNKITCRVREYWLVCGWLVTHYDVLDQARRLSCHHLCSLVLRRLPLHHRSPVTTTTVTMTTHQLHRSPVATTTVTMTTHQLHCSPTYRCHDNTSITATSSVSTTVTMSSWQQPQLSWWHIHFLSMFWTWRKSCQK